nr:hypothetical protein CFP56_16746 [Quercus suber]
MHDQVRVRHLMGANLCAIHESLTGLLVAAVSAINKNSTGYLSPTQRNRLARYLDCLKHMCHYSILVSIIRIFRRIDTGFSRCR